MKINNNMSALFTLNELNRNGNKLGKVAKKAASGIIAEYRECADRAQYDGHCRGRYSGDY